MMTQIASAAATSTNALGIVWKTITFIPRVVWSMVGHPYLSAISRGSSYLITLAYAAMLVKYFWGIKLLPLIPFLGFKSDMEPWFMSMSSSTWAAYAALLFLLINGTQLAFGNYRNGMTVVADNFTSMFPAGVVAIAFMASHLNILGGLSLNATQYEVLYMFVLACAVDMLVYPIIASRLNRNAVIDPTNVTGVRTNA